MINIDQTTQIILANQINSFDTSYNVQTAEAEIGDMIFVIEVVKYVKNEVCVNVLSHGGYTLDEYETEYGYEFRAVSLVGEDGNCLAHNFNVNNFQKLLN